MLLLLQLPPSAAMTTLDSDVIRCDRGSCTQMNNGVDNQRKLIIVYNEFGY